VADKKEAASEKKYATRCMKMPSLLLRSGLVQSTAFVLGRDDKAETQYLDDFAKAIGYSDGRALDGEARKANLEVYLRLSRDAVEVATWFRRFAQTELDADEAGS
jgi:CRISPR/Cas system CMR-associated protein Cmr5 small subunit